MDLTIDPRRAALGLAGGALLLAAAGTAGYLGQYVAGEGTRLGRFSGTLRQLFRLNAEGNISSWYATALLLGCALLLSCIAGGTAAARMPFARHWWGLAAIFVFLCLDEAISIHESFDGWAQVALGTRGPLLYAWVVPYALFALAVALAYLRLLLSLSRTVRLVFVLAGAVYVGGALGFEPIQGYITTIQGRQGGMVHAATVVVEEMMEMLGAVLFIYALLTHLAAQRGRVEFRDEPLQPQRRNAPGVGGGQFRELGPPRAWPVAATRVSDGSARAGIRCGPARRSTLPVYPPDPQSAIRYHRAGDHREANGMCRSPMGWLGGTRES